MHFLVEIPGLLLVILMLLQTYVVCVLKTLLRQIFTIYTFQDLYA